MSMQVDESTREAPGEVHVVSTLDGPAVTRADRYVLVSDGLVIQLHPLGSTDVEFGTDGHGLGRVRYQQVEQVRDQVWLYERLP